MNDDHQKLKISLRDVAVSYNGQVALRGVNLDIPENQITGLIGPSGCGKSSLLASINRMTDLTSGCKVSGSITLDAST